jgi:hypothetical protein
MWYVIFLGITRFLIVFQYKNTVTEEPRTSCNNEITDRNLLEVPGMMRVLEVSLGRAGVFKSSDRILRYSK